MEETVAATACEWNEKPREEEPEIGTEAETIGRMRLCPNALCKGRKSSKSKLKARS